jgi:pimeloyl-ACP methyl ester carboxylesterase
MTLQRLSPLSADRACLTPFLPKPSPLAPPSPRHRPRRPPAPSRTVVLVHGAFTDTSAWNDVVRRLQDQGYPVLAPANPLRSVAPTPAMRPAC